MIDMETTTEGVPVPVIVILRPGDPPILTALPPEEGET